MQMRKDLGSKEAVLDGRKRGDETRQRTDLSPLSLVNLPNIALWHGSSGWGMDLCSIQQSSGHDVGTRSLHHCSTGPLGFQPCQTRI